MLTPMQAVASIAVMAVVTFLTRALPFLLFDRGSHPPKLVLYLGRVLPPAIIAMLIVYCLRSLRAASLFAPAGWLPPGRGPRAGRSGLGSVRLMERLTFPFSVERTRTFTVCPSCK